MDRLDTGVVLCQLAEALQEKMILASYGKVPSTVNSNITDLILK